MKKITKYFLNGLLFLVPLVVTIYVLYIAFVKIDGIFKFKIPGISFIVTFLLITLFGMFASFFMTKGLLKIVDGIFSRVPFVKIIYTSLKDLMSAFVGDKKSFDRPVLVTISRDGNIQVMGFLTCNNLENIGLPNSVAVYLPQSYNFAGNLIIVPKEQVIPLSFDSGKTMAFLVSGGITI